MSKNYDHNLDLINKNIVKLQNENKFIVSNIANNNLAFKKLKSEFSNNFSQMSKDIEFIICHLDNNQDNKREVETKHLKELRSMKVQHQSQ